jgi:hypothetical protein
MRIDDEPADFRIARDGTWFHNGAPIKRDALAKLFSDRALKIDEQGNYWLATPFDKYPVVVEDVPYIIVDYTETPEGLILKTNMEEMVELGPEHPFELREGIPYIEVRNRLFARLSRSVYYNLVERFGPYVESRGMSHPLGELSEER